jgi:prophage DNA circulation protein
MDWQVLSSNSHYKTAIAIKDELQKGNTQEAYTGIEELIEALSRSDKRALKSQLIRLMVHVIKWKSQPERRSFSWVASINNAREEILDIQEETSSLTQQVVLEIWDKCLQIALRNAQGEMNKKTGSPGNMSDYGKI